MSRLTKEHFVKAVVVVVTLSIAAFSGYMMFDSFDSKGPASKEMATYNKGVSLMEEGKYKQALEKFSEVQQLPPENSKLDVYALYNTGHIFATQGEGSSKTLLKARGFYVEALKITPDNVDIRKNIEILNEKIVRQLQKEGKSEEEAKEIVDGNKRMWPKPGEKPGDGKEDGKSTTEEDY